MRKVTVFGWVAVIFQGLIGILAVPAALWGILTEQLFSALMATVTCVMGFWGVRATLREYKRRDLEVIRLKRKLRTLLRSWPKSKRWRLHQETKRSVHVDHSLRFSLIGVWAIYVYRELWAEEREDDWRVVPGDEETLMEKIYLLPRGDKSVHAYDRPASDRNRPLRRQLKEIPGLWGLLGFQPLDVGELTEFISFLEATAAMPPRLRT